MDNKEQVFFCFDVESVGLLGEGFQVGFVVVDRTGTEIDSGFYSCHPYNAARCSFEDYNWVMENVMPSTQIDFNVTNKTIFLPNGFCYNLSMVRYKFWYKWKEWKNKGALLVTDCGFPVETNFLMACINDDVKNNKEDSPYPLLDLSSILFAAGKDPIGTFDRLPNELPAHNALNDARQSARILIDTLQNIEFDGFIAKKDRDYVESLQH